MGFNGVSVGQTIMFGSALHVRFLAMRRVKTVALLQCDPKVDVGTWWECCLEAADADAGCALPSGERKRR